MTQEFVDDQSGTVQLAVQLGPKLKNGTGKLTAQINGETQTFLLTLYSKPTQARKYTRTEGHFGGAWFGHRLVHPCL